MLQRVWANNIRGSMRLSLEKKKPSWRVGKKGMWAVQSLQQGREKRPAARARGEKENRGPGRGDAEHRGVTDRKKWEGTAN